MFMILLKILTIIGEESNQSLDEFFIRPKWLNNTSISRLTYWIVKNILDYKCLNFDDKF